MKPLLLLLVLTIGIPCCIYAQSTDTTSDPGYTASTPTAKKPMSPTDRASRQLGALQQKLNLNQDQVIKLRTILLRRNIALDSLNSSPSADKKADNQARRSINQDADGQTYALLSVEQQLAYAQWKKDQKQKQMEKRMMQQSNNVPQPDSTNKPQQR